MYRKPFDCNSFDKRPVEAQLSTPTTRDITDVLSESVGAAMEEEDDLAVLMEYEHERISPISFDRGTVTTIESHQSSIATHDSFGPISKAGEHVNDIPTQSKNNPSCVLYGDSPLVSRKQHSEKSPPRACLDLQSENPDEWDLDVADKELLGHRWTSLLESQSPGNYPTSWFGLHATMN